MQAAGRLSLLLLLISFCSLLNQGEAKAGTCPPERYVTAINDRAKWCQDHESCPGDKLCCPHAKGKVCKTPAGVRPGECPPSINAQKSCNDNCTSDAECAPELKCCFKECGNICMPAMGVSESPGFCPAAAPNLSPCFVPCKNCPSGQKCCPVNCIDECATALSEKPGSCPPTTIFCIQGSHQMCAGDTTCSGEEKCCTYKCGQACMPKDAGS